jgi:glutathione peroxidase
VFDDTVYRFSAPLLNAEPTTPASAEAPISLGEFRGSVLLIVNTASKCGFTPQYAGLEKLFQTYKTRGFQVLGFPCNQFGAQEAGSEEKIGAFCQKNYGVSFPMFAKIEVNGPGAHPLYRFLREKQPGILGIFGVSRIRWNFTKFLINRQGEVVSRHGPSTTPKSLAPAIEALLGL